MLRVDDDGSALDLRVADPAAVPAMKTVAPMKVDSQEKVLNLDSDGFDDKSADKIGVNGWRVVRVEATPTRLTASSRSQGVQVTWQSSGPATFSKAPPAGTGTSW